MEIVESNLKLIWQRLHLPELQQIDMAIKYSSNITATELNKVETRSLDMFRWVFKRTTVLLSNDGSSTFIISVMVYAHVIWYRSPISANPC